MIQNNPERSKTDFVVRPRQPGEPEVVDLISLLFEGAVADEHGVISLRIRVEGGAGVSDEALANKFISGMQDLGVEAFPEPRFPGHSEESAQ